MASDSDDAIRHSRASESVSAAFIAAGIPSPPGDLAAIVTTYVKNSTKEIPHQPDYAYDAGQRRDLCAGWIGVRINQPAIAIMSSRT
jgi:hypothetical protein